VVLAKRPELWDTCNSQLHHDNASAHLSHLIQGFLAKHGIPQALYSPEMAPCGFMLFPRLKPPLKGSRFKRRKDIIQRTMVQLHTIPKQAFQKCLMEEPLG
jgi:hypothetical protein